MRISGSTDVDLYSTITYEKNETQSVEATSETAAEETTQAIQTKVSSNANVQELFEAQQQSSASVNIQQVDTSNVQVVNESTESSDEEETTTKLVYNSDGSVEQVTTITDADGNTTEERVQISGSKEETAENDVSDMHKDSISDKEVN